MKQFLFDRLKNILGYRTKRKLIAISVDDYGNVRLDSKKAREKIDQAGLKVHSRFDAYDTLETRADLEALFNVLTSVKDSNGRPAVLTPYTLTHNIDFERMKENGWNEYYLETLADSFVKLEQLNPKAYQGVWALWKEGISKGIFIPQFHGREHFNLNAFNIKLRNRDKELITSLENRSLTSISDSEIPNVGWTAAYSFNELDEANKFPDIIREGLITFENLFGFKTTCFTPPAQQFPLQLESMLLDNDVCFMDKPFMRNKHVGRGKYKREINWTGKKINGIKAIVRNVVFEPTDGNIDHVTKAMNQIEAAFSMQKVAHVSSHRVNFCGHIDEKNREKGISSLKTLLERIVKKWPDVEFISVTDLCKELN